MALNTSKCNRLTPLRFKVLRNVSNEYFNAEEGLIYLTRESVLMCGITHSLGRLKFFDRKTLNSGDAPL